VFADNASPVASVMLQTISLFNVWYVIFAQYFTDDKTLWKIWSEVVGKPTKGAIAKACAFANCTENSPLVYPDLEHILLEGLKLNRAVPVLNAWYELF